MALAPSLERYLIKNGVHYDVIVHRPTKHSNATANAAHVPAACLAKSVVLRDQQGYLIAVMPADRRLRLGWLHARLGRSLGLATEAELRPLFGDCAMGAIPPLGPAYGLEVIVDDSLSEQADIYFEGGDHQELVRVAGMDFQRLLSDALHGQISAPSLQEAQAPH